MISKILLKRSEIIRRKNLAFWIFGFVAFVWVIIRTGVNPKRLTYPCQQAALPLASSWFIAILGIIGGIVMFKRFTKVFFILIIVSSISFVYFKYFNINMNKTLGDLPVWESSNTVVSEVYVYDNVIQSKGSLSAGNEFVDDSYLSDPGIDSLIQIMNTKGLYLHKNSIRPNGLVGSEDIVIIKGNFQWRNRMSTNTDRVKGVIWQLLSHPDAFSGEILVCDNTQSQIWESTSSDYFGGFNDRSNNSDDLEQSIVDVVNTFKAKGYPVDYYVWDSLNNNNAVHDYDKGDMNDGYVYNPTQHTSYPKFKTPKDNLVSLKNGIWNSESESFEKDKLVIINMPILKAHGMAGATIACKNYIGCMNVVKTEEWYGADNNSFHDNYCFNEFALVARQLDETWPDLNIIDATWVAPVNNYSYTQESVQANTLIASTDPVAASWYSAKYILQPLVSQYNEYKVNPDDIEGTYGKNLNYWYVYLKENTQRIVTKDPDEISVYGKEVLALGTSAISERVKENISIYPTVVYNDFLTIKSPIECSVKIVDLAGRTVLSSHEENNEHRISLNLKSGAYLVQVLNDRNKILKTEKILIR